MTIDFGVTLFDFNEVGCADLMIDINVVKAGAVACGCNATIFHALNRPGCVEWLK